MARQFINPHTIREDIMAGLVLGIESVPDGLAQGFLAFVNPVYGLYAYMMGTFSAAFFTSSTFMVVQATG
ncbi:MAG TPA: SulP family inorganic anion transporter, partial [Chloroflexi bacterium]|nr:SulP family inorganic anion transporter [Chloroflexota bacterium]